MKSPFQVSLVFNADLGANVWSLTRIDGKLLNTDGAVAYNFDSEAAACDALRGLSHRYYQAQAEAHG